jgi:hypothetical protein
MSNGYNLGQAGTMTPELFAEQQDLNRQQRMAQMLMQQGQQAPQGQMISGRYVAPSIFQNLASLAQTGAGAYLQSKGDEKALDLAKKLREEGKVETQRLMSVLAGTPEREQVTEMAGPYGVSGAGQNVPMPTATQTIPAQPGDARLALAEAMNMSSPQAKALIPTLVQRALPEPTKPTTEMQNYNFAVEKGFKGSFNDFKNQMNDYQRANINIEREKAEREARRDAENTNMSMVNNNGIPVGRYDKTGRYISPQGRVYTASAVTEAQKEHDVATDLAYKLNNISKEDIKNAFGSVMDYTTTKAGQMIGNKEVVAAQNKINDIQIKKILDNLSQLKGASSDKEMAQMIKDFPGYTAAPEIMEKWTDRAAKTTNRFLNRSEQRFGFDTDYAQEDRFKKEEKPKPSQRTGQPKFLGFE